VFRTHFDAPVGGSLTVVWKTTVTSGNGKHKKRRTIAVARGIANADSATTINLTLHLTGTGRALLRKNTSELPIAASENFRPNAQAPNSVTTKFAL
jgi:hypothetical protein